MTSGFRSDNRLSRTSFVFRASLNAASLEASGKGRCKREGKGPRRTYLSHGKSHGGGGAKKMIF